MSMDASTLVVQIGTKVQVQVDVKVHQPTKEFKALSLDARYLTHPWPLHNLNKSVGNVVFGVKPHLNTGSMSTPRRSASCSVP